MLTSTAVIWQKAESPVCVRQVAV